MVVEAQTSIRPPAPELFGPERARRFVRAMTTFPKARQSELDHLDSVLRGLAVSPCGSIADLGAGHGFVTGHMLRFLAPGGRIHAQDTSAEMLAHVPVHPQIEHHVTKLDRLSSLATGSIDLALTFASFHHVNNKNQVLEEIARVLRPGGLFIISDVCDETPTQRFFDSVVRYHSETGHETDFLTDAWVRLLARRARLEVVSSSLVPTPWRFDRTADMLAFMHDLFGLILEVDALADAIERLLAVDVEPATGKVVVGWSQGVHVLRQPDVKTSGR